MNTPIVNLSLPLQDINNILNSLAQCGNSIGNTQQVVQSQAQAQLSPPPAPVPPAADAEPLPDNVTRLLPGTPA